MPSVEEKVGLPALVERSDKMPDERDVVRTHRLPAKQHMRLFRSPVPLLVVAVNARAHEIVPCVLPPARNRNDVIHRQREIPPPAELATMAVAAKNVLPR